MELAVLAGVRVSEFWELTPVELKLTLRRLKLVQKEELFKIYLLSRWVWAKKIDIEKILEEEKEAGEKTIMTDEEILQQARRLNKLFGGEEID